METERLLLRRFAPSDARDLFAYLSDEDVVRYEPYGVFDEAQAACEAERRARDDAFWAVCLKRGGGLIGNLYFAQQSPHRLRTWELGFVFHARFQHRGYATEAAARMLRYGFEERDAHRIEAYCDPRNEPSWRLLERLHMRREGHFRQRDFFERDAHGTPVWHDAYAYAMLADEWRAARRGDG